MLGAAMFVGGGGVNIPGYTGNRAWGDPAFRDLVPFVSVLAVRRICGGVGGPARMPDQGGRRRRCTDRGLAGGPDANRCNQLTAINFNVEIEVLGIDALSAFRQQQIRQNDSRTLEPVGEVMHFGNKLETIENIRGRRDDFGEIACVPGLFPSCAAHPYPPVTTNGVLETNAA